MSSEPTEAQLERSVRDVLELDGWIVRHIELNWSERKKKSVGERGMPDLLAIRYLPDEDTWLSATAQVLWIELKTPRGKLTVAQHGWHLYERKIGATTWIAGQDFPATVEGFVDFYSASGLRRPPIR